MRRAAAGSNMCQARALYSRELRAVIGNAFSPSMQEYGLQEYGLQELGLRRRFRLREHGQARPMGSKAKPQTVDRIRDPPTAARRFFFRAPRWSGLKVLGVGCKKKEGRMEDG